MIPSINLINYIYKDTVVDDHCIRRITSDIKLNTVNIDYIRGRFSVL